LFVHLRPPVPRLGDHRRDRAPTLRGAGKGEPASGTFCFVARRLSGRSWRPTPASGWPGPGSGVSSPGRQRHVYRRGITAARIAVLVNGPASTVRYHLQAAKSADPGLPAEHQPALATSTRRTPKAGLRNLADVCPSLPSVNGPVARQPREVRQGTGPGCMAGTPAPGGSRGNPLPRLRGCPVAIPETGEARRPTGSAASPRRRCVQRRSACSAPVEGPPSSPWNALSGSKLTIAKVLKI
jgi:hypothetical protein